MHCKTFNNYTQGSDPWRGWNAAECKYTLEVLLAGVSTKRAAKQHMHLNKIPLQHIEKLSVARFQQAHSQVQMQQKMGASEPYHKTESGSQTASNKHIARFSTTTPKVQIPGGAGMPRNANVPWRHFRQGYPPNAQQNSTCI